MKHRSRAGSVKTRRRKSATPKGGNAPKATRNRGASLAGEGTVVARLTNERDEALLRETANSEILHLISKSPGDLELVFRSILENATRICNAKFGTLFRFDGENFHPVAQFNTPAALLEAFTRRGPFKPTPGILLDHVMRTKQVAHTADSAAEPVSGLAQKLGGARSLVCVPMLKDGVLVGAITIYRQEVRPFTDKQIELVQNFAAQAVIAIENTRLLNELRQRTADLSESLEQQTATSEVLKVISSSPGELQPVFHAMLENATRLCEAKFGTMFRFDGGFFHLAAQFGIPPELAEHQRRRGPYQPPPGSLLDRVMRTKQVSHTADFTGDDLVPGASARLGGARSLVCVPMLKDDVLIGAISIYRQEVQPFTEKQIELVQNFAAQAIIAIENARLLNELRGSLERQTATADILRVIASTPEDSKHALDTIAETASRMFGVANVNFRRIEGDVLRIISSAGPTIERLRKALPDIPLEPTDPAVRCFLDNHQIAVEDRQAVLANERGAIAAALRELPVRSQVFTPLSRQGKAIGVMIVTRGEAQPFSQGDLDLMKGFADQAVIAIENARLLNELRDSLGRQTATSEVLSAISSSRGNLAPVFHAILENATRICEATFGSMLLREGDIFRRAAIHNAPPQFEEHVKNVPILKRGMAPSVDHVTDTGQVSQTLDAAAEEPNAPIARYAGARTLLDVPLLKGNDAIGVLGIYRQEVRPFTDRQIELVKSFAAQAVIAIENARLLNDLNKLNQQLEQRVTDQVGEIERMGRLRRFLPPQVADLIVASGTEKQLESHRREITALFCDLRGFTGFSESSDPEDVMALLAEYHAAIGTIINKYSGTLERYAGDGVMVIFNDPVPVENPALQAVLMALDMRAAIGALIEKWRDLGHDLGFGIGIAHGFATLGTIGFEGRRDYAAIGTVSNVASRLCDEAKPGQILISPRVRQAVEKAVTVESVGEFALKGIRRPMLAYNVLESSSSKPN